MDRYELRRASQVSEPLATSAASRDASNQRPSASKAVVECLLKPVEEGSSLLVLVERFSAGTRRMVDAMETGGFRSYIFSIVDKHALLVNHRELWRMSNANRLETRRFPKHLATFRW